MIRHGKKNHLACSPENLADFFSSDLPGDLAMKNGEDLETKKKPLKHGKNSSIVRCKTQKENQNRGLFDLHLV